MAIRRAIILLIDNGQVQAMAKRVIVVSTNVVSVAISKAPGGFAPAASGAVPGTRAGLATKPASAIILKLHVKTPDLHALGTIRMIPTAMSAAVVIVVIAVASLHMRGKFKKRIMMAPKAAWRGGASLTAGREIAPTTCHQDRRASRFATPVSLCPARRVATQAYCPQPLVTLFASLMAPRMTCWSDARARLNATTITVVSSLRYAHATLYILHQPKLPHLMNCLVRRAHWTIICSFLINCLQEGFRIPSP